MIKRLLLLPIFMLAQMSWAGTVTTTGTFGPTNLAFGSGSNISVNPFDTALGTLTGITLTLEGSISNFTYSLTNPGGQAGTLMSDSQGGALMHLYSPGSTGIELAVVFPALVIPTQTIQHTTVSVGPGGNTQTDAGNVVPSSVWSYFQGPGPVLLPLDGTQYYSVVASGGTLNPSASGMGSATATVTYTYADASSVPEPAMMSLVGGGLLGIAFMARRRKKA